MRRTDSTNVYSGEPILQVPPKYGDQLSEPPHNFVDYIQYIL